MAARRSSFSPGRMLGSVFLLVAVSAVLYFRLKDQLTSGDPAPPMQPGEYLFCFWNVENLFDDRDDNRNSVDEEYDNWLARNPKDLQLKLDHLSDALLRMNNGQGPDMLAICEVESVRAAELLRDALNKKLPQGAVPYGDVRMKEVGVGRHIAPAVISRLATDASATKLHGKGQRILETRITVGERSLTIIASHWTSQLSDKTGDSRDRYADLVYEEFRKSFRADPNVDFLICGDFNTDPANESVTQNLHAIASRGSVAGSKEPFLLNVFAGKDSQQFGTHTYNKKPLIYDHICISPGLLDEQGWSCDPDSARTFTDGLMRPSATYRQPWRFGNEKDSGGRGYSDHFPVTVKLRVR
jgi:endonuclease/exonuclease/phosphatase family metal-dependent hydrolase